MIIKAKEKEPKIQIENFRLTVQHLVKDGNLLFLLIVHENMILIMITIHLMFAE